MKVLVITPPPAIVSLEEAKRHLDVVDDAQDTLIQSLIDAAIGHVDGPAGWLNRALGPQTLELRLTSFFHERCTQIRRNAGHWSAIVIPYPPIVSVASVTYADAAGEDQMMDPAAYRLGSHGLAPVYGTSWPTARLDDDSVRIRYQAGWPMTEGDNPVWTGPPGVKVAILMMVGDLFENRESQVIVDSRAVQFSNPNADLLLAPWKVWA